MSEGDDNEGPPCTMCGIVCMLVMLMTLAHNIWHIPRGTNIYNLATFSNID